MIDIGFCLCLASIGRFKRIAFGHGSIQRLVVRADTLKSPARLISILGPVKTQRDRTYLVKSMPSSSSSGSSGLIGS